GDFEASLDLSGVGAPRNVALGSARIAGSLVGRDEPGGAINWQIRGDAGSVAVAGELAWWNGSATGKFKSLLAGQVTEADLTVADALGSVKAARWTGGKIEADTVKSFYITGKRLRGAEDIIGDFQGDLTVTGELGTFTVLGTARNSTVCAGGSIRSIVVGATDGSDFLAGVADDTLDPADVQPADLAAGATIRSLTVRGWRVPRGQAVPRFVLASNFLASQFGTVRLTNAGGGESYKLHLPAEDDIRSLSHKDTQDRENTWTWRPGKPYPQQWVGSPPMRII
ncbi:MAG: hypothetical protein J7M21_04915, partial [Planctomycetes bacterium]|nr:hypothetical protein [Planctomycetota bacterium]